MIWTDLLWGPHTGTSSDPRQPRLTPTATPDTHGSIAFWDQRLLADGGTSSSSSCAMENSYSSEEQRARVMKGVFLEPFGVTLRHQKADGKRF